jgi:hypothetical protein
MRHIQECSRASHGCRGTVLGFVFATAGHGNGRRSRWRTSKGGIVESGATFYRIQSRSLDVVHVKLAVYPSFARACVGPRRAVEWDEACDHPTFKAL